MHITFLGTGTSGGVPLIGCQCRVCKSEDQRDKRLRTSVLIQDAGLNVVMDCGPDFRQQMLREDVRSIDGIVMTHSHKDHTGGLDDIRALNFIMDRAIDIYCNERTEADIREQYSYIFTNTDYPYLPRMNFVRIQNAEFSIKQLKVQPIEVMHADMAVLGFRFGDFTYITDAKTIAKPERKKMQGTKVLVINALRFEDHYSHLSVNEALEVAADVKAEMTCFVHMSHQFGLHAEVEKKLPANVRPAYDGLKIEV